MREALKSMPTSMFRAPAGRVEPQSAEAGLRPLAHSMAHGLEELANSFPGWKVEFIQLHPGPVSGNVLAIPLDRLRLIRACLYQPLLMRYTTPADCVTFSVHESASDAVMFDGIEVADGECLLSSSQAVGETVSRGISRPITLSIPRDVWRTESDWLLPPACLAASGVVRSRPGSEWNAVFVETVDWIVRSMIRFPQACMKPLVRRGFEELLLARVSAFLPECPQRISGTRATRIARRNAVERARRYMEDNLSQPQRLSDVCRHARIEARSLELAFRELLGISPMAYLRLMRLHSARRRLSCAEERHESVSRTALDCGCWHLSQFAVDYKRLFGESPSATRQRTLAGRPS